MPNERLKESAKKLAEECKNKGFNKQVYFILCVFADCQQTYEHTGWDTETAIDYILSLFDEYDEEETILTLAQEITGYESDPDEEPFDPEKFINGE